MQKLESKGKLSPVDKQKMEEKIAKKEGKLIDLKRDLEKAQNKLDRL